MKSIILSLFTIIVTILSDANSEGINLWRLDSAYLEVSKEAIRAPSVRLLDPPTLEFYKKLNKLGTVELSEKQIIDVLKSAPLLNPANEPFASIGLHYGLQIDNINWILIYRDKSNRFEIATAIEINGLIFQKTDRKYYKATIFPKVEELIIKSLETPKESP